MTNRPERATPPNLFAAFDRTAKRAPLDDCTIERGTAAHARAIAEIGARRVGRDVTEQDVQRLVTDFDRIAPGDHTLFYCVAVVRGRVVGFSRARYVEPAQMTGARNLRPGWYLVGVIVDPPYRRRGVGLGLTRARIDEIRARGGDAVYYFSNAQNQTSIEFHAKLGFAELTRDFQFPGVQFAGGVGILFELLPPTTRSQ